MGVCNLEMGKHVRQALFGGACRESSEGDGPFIVGDSSARPMPVQGTPARCVGPAAMTSGSCEETGRGRGVVRGRVERDGRDGEGPECTEVVSQIVGRAEGEDGPVCGCKVLVVDGD